jgi:hypothetical protein
MQCNCLKYNYLIFRTPLKQKSQNILIITIFSYSVEVSLESALINNVYNLIIIWHRVVRNESNNSLQQHLSTNTYF